LKGSTGYSIQLQVKYKENTHWLAETDYRENEVFHAIDLKKGYHFAWKQLDPDTPNTVEKIRIRCLMPGYHSLMNDFACIDAGDWRIGNICPIK
jgi:hypothetical protein